MIQIAVSQRTIGKGVARRARLKRKIPAHLYGPKAKNTSLFVDELTLERYGNKKFESTIFELNCEDNKELDKIKVLLKAIQVNPVNHRPVHVDFYAIDMSSSIRINVEIKLEGLPLGVKEEGGLLTQVLREVEIECAPGEIPSGITVDVSDLALNQSLHISDIKLPSSAKAVTAPGRTIATVTPASREEDADSDTPAEAEPLAAETKSEA